MKLSKKSLTGIIAAASLAICGYIFASPWLAAASLRDAAQRHDAAELSDRVDFPALRESIKGNLNEQVFNLLATAEITDKKIIASTMAFFREENNTMIEAMLTPPGLAAMLRGEIASITPARNVEATGAWQKGAKLGYETFDRFAISIPAADGSQRDVLLKRDGIASWKLAAVRLSN